MIFLMWLLFILTFLLGYYLGGKGQVIAKEMADKVELLVKGKPKPGVVRKLTPEEIIEKHDPIKKGNKEAFDRFFRTNPPTRP